MDKKHFFNSPSQYCFLFGLFIVIAFNGFSLFKETYKIQKIKSVIPHQEVGKKFYGLNTILKNIEYVGYYTDKDLKTLKNNKQLTEAQYIIAPTILDLNNTKHQYILFDCSNEEIALKKIKKLGVIPLQKHQGLILTKNLKFAKKTYTP